MIILIAPKEDITNEIQILNKLFKSGLEYYHLRKPHKNYQDHTDFLKEIDSKYHNRIVIHDFHELTNEFDLKGIHFEEEDRRNYIETPTRYFKDLNLFGKTISSTFHDLKELAESDFEFDYHIFGPSYTTNSKSTPTEIRCDISDVDKLIIAKEGIVTNTIKEALTLGYNGLAILESVWNSQNPIQSFKDIKAMHDAIGS